MDETTVGLVVKSLIGLAVSAFSFLAYRAVNTHDNRISKIEERVSSLEDKITEVGLLSVKIDLLMNQTNKINDTLEELNKRVQGTELGIARLGTK